MRHNMVAGFSEGRLKSLVLVKKVAGESISSQLKPECGSGVLIIKQIMNWLTAFDRLGRGKLIIND